MSTTIASPDAPAPAADREQLLAALRRSAGWFFLIAGLSAVNTAMLAAGSEITFVVGLVATQIVDAFATGMIQGGGPEALRFIAFGIDTVLVGLFAGFGLKARAGARWALVAGTALYALDAALALPFQDWMSLAFHGLALFYLSRGFGVLKQLEALGGGPSPEPPRPNPLVR